MPEKEHTEHDDYRSQVMEFFQQNQKASVILGIFFIVLFVILILGIITICMTTGGKKEKKSESEIREKREVSARNSERIRQTLIEEQQSEKFLDDEENQNDMFLNDSDGEEKTGLVNDTNR